VTSLVTAIKLEGKDMFQINSASKMILCSEVKTLSSILFETHLAYTHL
jgi:hypothetical protein